MELELIFGWFGKVVAACATVTGAWWAVEKWRNRDEHFPRVYFETTVNFLGVKDEHIVGLHTPMTLTQREVRTFEAFVEL